ncbi:hypothetical protein DERF_012819 [Dermatophagoides farinae]|uniref:Uncharacterized protein n=1 Tax=Dermatophagoides farinae TaxID=6954 RepID=A0A922HSN1_DERFA|nr:hypothetical protein DERF_012819 [Dermatophagoides farinae]
MAMAAKIGISSPSSTITTSSTPTMISKKSKIKQKALRLSIDLNLSNDDSKTFYPHFSLKKLISDHDEQKAE